MEAEKELKDEGELAESGHGSVSPPKCLSAAEIKAPCSPHSTKEMKGSRTASSSAAMTPPTTAKAPRNGPAGGPQEHQQSNRSDSKEPSPVASPSSISISSKTTIRTGPAAAQSVSSVTAALGTSSIHSIGPDPFLPPVSSLDSVNTMDASGGVNISSPSLSGTFRTAGSSRAGSMASPKLSPTVGAPSRKNLEYSQNLPPPPPQQQSTTQQFSCKLEHPPLPLPRKARRCPLFCCFYAEFDNVVGPKVCYESPLGFMEQNSDVSLKDIHKLLASNFDRILSEQNGPIVRGKKEKETKPTQKAGEAVSGTPEPASWSSSSKGASDSTATPAQSPSNSYSQLTIKGAKSVDSTVTMAVANTTAAAATPGIHRRQQSATASADAATLHASNANIAKDSSAGPNKQEGGSTSIFESTCDFIITGNELTGNIVNLSAFNMHLLTRPSIIHNKRYERNSLLFCVGFILRRTEDPRPFRPLLSKLALTLKRMEMESSFLSKQSTRKEIQPLLDRILVSLNCTKIETNLVVNNTVLNLKLFHPPKYPASPVKDHSVPILLRRDWQVQMYDWDLAINWVVLHIDGVANARQISKKAEVDMSMVRNCLRVLKHHGVISVVDMFFYSNRYESTKRAASMLAGHEPSLLQDAAEYVLKRPAQATTPLNAMTPYNSLVAPMSPPPSASPTLQERFVHPHVSSPGSPILPSSFPHEHGDSAAAVSSSLLGSSLKYATFAASYQSHDPQVFGTLRKEEQRELKTALAELYCACNRDMSFGDLWVAFAAGRARSHSFDRSVERNRSNSDSRDASRHSYQQQSNHNTNSTYQGHSLTRGDSIEISGSEGTGEHHGEATDLPFRD
eukprot:Sro263_g102160.2  (847) ;mRNA; f:7569-10111